MAQKNTISALFDPQDIYRGPYAARLETFAEAGRSTLLPDSGKEKIALILVDYQHDFVDPSGTLSVPGALEDIGRLLSWFYRNASKINQLYISLDTHLPNQIFFGNWWVNQRGEHPQPYTAISTQDLQQAVWRPVKDEAWSLMYVEQLQKQARKDLMIWPFHTMQGTLGHMLSAPISEAIAWHSAARQVQPCYITKGLTPRTEYYGIFGAEIPDPADPTTHLNQALLAEFTQYDRIYIAGEAKSHCVLESERQLVTSWQDQPTQLNKLYFLTDCTSSVRHPIINFDAIAQHELELMQRMGVNLVNTTLDL